MATYSNAPNVAGSGVIPTTYTVPANSYAIVNVRVMKANNTGVTGASVDGQLVIGMSNGNSQSTSIHGQVYVGPGQTITMINTSGGEINASFVLFTNGA